MWVAVMECVFGSSPSLGKSVTVSRSLADHRDVTERARLKTHALDPCGKKTKLLKGVK